MTAFRDRTFSRAIGASCALHGAMLALLLIGWRSQPVEDATSPPIPVTLIEAESAPTADATSIATATYPPTPPTPLPETPPARVFQRAPAPNAVAQRNPPRDPAPAPQASSEITALLQQGVSGRPLGSSGVSRSAIDIRSSVPLSDDYLIRLQAWLARFQDYPVAAEARHEEGKGVVAFSLARDGKVLRVWMDASTGSATLDNASIAMVDAASPLPPLPQAIAGDAIDFYLPINYGLSNYQRLFQ